MLHRPFISCLRNAQRLLFAAAFALTASVSANAASVTWTLNNFVFDDNATASGSFVWDGATNSITSWNIATTAGTLNAENYSSASGDDNAVTNTEFQTLRFLTYFGPATVQELRIGLSSLDLLDTPVASLGLFSNKQGQSGANGFIECELCAPVRLGKAGAFLSVQPASANGVPEPATLALVGLSLGMAGVAGRRRTA